MTPDRHLDLGERLFVSLAPSGAVRKVRDDRDIGFVIFRPEDVYLVPGLFGLRHACLLKLEIVVYQHLADLTHLIRFALRALGLDVDPARYALLAVNEVVPLDILAEPESFQQRPSLLEWNASIRAPAKNTFE